MFSIVLNYALKKKRLVQMFMDLFHNFIKMEGDVLNKLLCKQSI